MSRFSRNDDAYLDAQYEHAMEHPRRLNARWNCSDGFCGGLGCTRCYGPSALADRETQDAEEAIREVAED